MPVAEQRLQRRADATAIDAAEITAKDRLVDLAGPTGIPRQQLAVEFVGRSVAADDPRTWDHDGPRPVGRGDRAPGPAVAVTAAPVGPLVSLGGQGRGELLLQSDLQRFSNLLSELRFDVLTTLQNGGGACASLLHGVILGRRCERRSDWVSRRLRQFGTHPRPTNRHDSATRSGQRVHHRQDAGLTVEQFKQLL
jgi:hypothetical protein